MENFDLILNKIQPVLQELAKSLGVRAELLWRILIRQQYIDGFLCLLWFIVGLVGLKYLVNFGLYLRKTNHEKENDASWFVLALVSTSVFFVIGINFAEAVNHFLNPEFQALKDIFHLIRGYTR